MRGIFCFRRDHRLHDNFGLNDLIKICDGGILPIFCLDPRQVDPKKNQYHSNLSVRFLFQSLADLDAQIRQACTKAKHPVVGLTVVAGPAEECIPALVTALRQSSPATPVTVGFNEDVTPFARERDSCIRAALSRLNEQEEKKSGDKKKKLVSCISNPDDLTVVPIRTLRTGTGNVYKVFTPFCRAARAQGIQNPVDMEQGCQFISLPQEKKPFEFEILDARTLVQLPRFKHVAEDKAVADITGGRTEALKRITAEFLNSHAKNYSEDRDFPWQDKTTKLSAFFKFGCISYREAHKAVMTLLPAHAATAKEALTREFFWATFYYNITLNFPHVLQAQKKVFDAKAANVENGDLAQGRYDYSTVWDYDEKAEENFKAWCDGKTGFPIIDAGMRQLNTTGWMHNRVRMAVASFLTKDLRVDWRWGEKYFAQKLVDYEPSANSGGWQWSSSTGADGQPWFRIFNPWNQSTKHDCNGVYIKKYIPELANVHPDDLHVWNEKRIRDKYKNDSLASKYPAPIVDHAAERLKTLEVWKKATGSGANNANDADDKNKNKKKKPAAKKAGTRRQRSVSSSSSSSSSSRSSSSSSSNSVRIVNKNKKNKKKQQQQPKPKNNANRQQATLDKWVK